MLQMIVFITLVLSLIILTLWFLRYMEYRESLQLMRDKSWIMKSQEFVSTRKFKSLLQYDRTFKRISNWASMNSALLSPISEEVSGQVSELPNTCMELIVIVRNRSIRLRNGGIRACYAHPLSLVRALKYLGNLRYRSLPRWFL